MTILENMFQTLKPFLQAKHKALSAAENALIDDIKAASPYLTRLLTQFDSYLPALLRADPDQLWPVFLDGFKACQGLAQDPNEQIIMAYLRQHKAFAALFIALQDIKKTWDLGKATHALSDFADACLALCLEFTLDQQKRLGRFDRYFSRPPSKGKAPEPSLSAHSFAPEALSTGALTTGALTTGALSNECGFFILALGKLGGHELNYSSDIDLIALYDPQKIASEASSPLQPFFTKLCQTLIKLLESRTEDGYVFRTDFRLRPDPASSALALSCDSAEVYYQSIAQNWERAAMIKARFVAGDKEAGSAYLKRLEGWIWRRSIDYTALRDITALKDQIDHHAGLDASFAGYNVKLGSGGIREIEFFAQILQLLHGGRQSELRQKSTLHALEMLQKKGLISHECQAALNDAYVFLRHLEHRLQMVDDAQTHSLPKDEASLTKIAHFMGYKNRQALHASLTQHRQNVRAHYLGLLPHHRQPAIKGAKPSLPDLIARYPFKEPEALLALLKGWQLGHHRALRSPQARALLEGLFPSLLEAFSASGDPDKSLRYFDHFLADLPSGVQVFALFEAQPKLLKLLGHIMGLAPNLGQMLARRPRLFDAVLDPDFFDPIEPAELISRRLDRGFNQADNYETLLDNARRVWGDYQFRIGVQMLEAIAPISELNRANARLADCFIKQLLPRLETIFMQEHGLFANSDAPVANAPYSDNSLQTDKFKLFESGFIILAIGQYGSGRLPPFSDLDLILLYQLAEGLDPHHSLSTGPSALAPSRYFSKFARFFLTAMTALTKEGRLFEIDMRLRPSGAQGPLAISFDSFQHYYQQDAWTYEYMALSRARFIAAPISHHAYLVKNLKALQITPHAPQKLLTDIAAMRRKRAENRNSKDQGKNLNWLDLKHTTGGLIDIEFICQYLLLRQAAVSSDTMLSAQGFPNEIEDQIAYLKAAKSLSSKESLTLQKGFRLQQISLSFLRLCYGVEPPYYDDILPIFWQKLASLWAIEGFDCARESPQEQLKKTQKKCRALYEKIIDKPAERLKKTASNTTD